MGLSFFGLLEIVLVITALAYVSYWGANTFFKARASKALMENPKPYHRPSEDRRFSLLVLGDSTAIGIGAEKPEESVPGLLAHFVGATHVENYGVVGAGVEDLPEQVAQAMLTRYDLILVMVGGNNILAFDDVRWAGRMLGEVLAELPEAGKVILLSAGNTGGATLFPPPVRPFHTLTNQRYHKEFARVAHAWGALYVNLYESPGQDPFLENPTLYLSDDGLHPSSEGYRLWFEKLRDAL